MRNYFMILLIIIANAYSIGAQDIAQFRGPERDGIFPDSGLLKEWPDTGPELLFSTSGIGKGFSSAVLDEGILYVTGMIDTLDYLSAIDEHGDIRWQKPYGRSWKNSFPDTRSTPTIENEYIYVLSGMGEVSCFSKTGEKIWYVNVDNDFETTWHRWGVSESLLIIDDMVICTPVGKKASMIALNKHNGNLIWSAHPVPGRRSYVSPILYEFNDIRLILGKSSTDLFAVNPENGTLEWTYSYYLLQPEKEDDEGNEGQEDEDTEEKEEPELGWIFTNTPIYHEDEIFITAGYDMAAAMLKLSPEGKSVSVKWIDHTFDNHHHGVVLVDGYIFGSNWYNNRDGRWVCMNWNTGEIQYVDEWRTKGNIIYADGLLYVYEERGNVGLVKPVKDGFEVISSFRISDGEGPHWAHLSIYEKKLLVRHGNVVLVYNIADSDI